MLAASAGLAACTDDDTSPEAPVIQVAPSPPGMVRWDPAAPPPEGLDRHEAYEFFGPLPVPTLLPAGYARCDGPRQADPTRRGAVLTAFCGPEGATIHARWDNGGLDPVRPDPPVTMTSTVEEGRRVILGTTPGGMVTLDVPASLPDAQVAAMTDSVLALDRRAWFWAGGDGDLRDQLSPADVRRWLEAAGARDVRVADADSEGEDAVEGGMGLVCTTEPCERPDPMPVEINATAPDGQPLEGWVGTAGALTDPRSDYATMIIRIETVDGVDLRVEGGTLGVRLRCGHLELSLRTRGIGQGAPPGPNGPIVDLVAALARDLDC